MEVTIFMERK
uniref:Uncharacterized protein n=1 Tax=Arundo donax TaxID=35708 RepID=A0A0A9SBS6_ARUDO